MSKRTILGLFGLFMMVFFITLSITNCNGTHSEISAEDSVAIKLVSLYNELSRTCKIIKFADSMNYVSVEFADSAVTKWNKLADKYNKVLSELSPAIINKYKLTYIKAMYRNPEIRPENPAIKPKAFKINMRMV